MIHFYQNCKSTLSQLTLLYIRNVCSRVINSRYILLSLVYLHTIFGGFVVRAGEIFVILVIMDYILKLSYMIDQFGLPRPCLWHRKLWLFHAILIDQSYQKFNVARLGPI